MAGYPIDFNAGGRVSAGVCSDANTLGNTILLPSQTHSCNVAVADRMCVLPDTDAVVTRVPGLRIGIRTADCIPLLLYAPDIGAIAAIHAGWRGSLGGIATRTVSVLQGIGADVSLLQAAFGPGICVSCYEVSAELAEEFRKAGFSDCIAGTRHLDLEAVNRRRLTDMGVPPENIRPKSRCTFETPALPSWRRDATTKRLVSWIELHQLTTTR
ncbi:MAG: polyphenol oxidase family protein [Muribaculaceae bacterium]|nr:polyphenol oxidase family protein [Muribaculaceae bacterium]MDE6331997.1 polyphenol oxidase family protein [Muribaculaceae bacterium]